MVSGRASCAERFEILAEVRYADAFLAALSPFYRRSSVGVALYGALLAVLAAGAWLVGGGLAWTALAAAAPGWAILALVAWRTARDYRRTGGKPARMLYRVSPFGVEILATGRSDWIAWDDLFDAAETRRSFILSPAPGQQYVIPKRSCRGAAGASLREALHNALLHGPESSQSL